MSTKELDRARVVARAIDRRLSQRDAAEVDERVGDGDFARREEVALALANEAVRAELTAALQDIVASHGTEDALVDGERYRFHEAGSQSRLASAARAKRWDRRGCRRACGRSRAARVTHPGQLGRPAPLVVTSRYRDVQLGPPQRVRRALEVRECDAQRLQAPGRHAADHSVLRSITGR